MRYLGTLVQRWRFGLARMISMYFRGVSTQPFSMATVAPLGTPNKELGDALKQLSAAKYGRPRQVVEKEIFARMDTVEVIGDGQTGAAFGFAGTPYGDASPSSSHGNAGGQVTSQSSGSGSSFLDQ